MALVRANYRGLLRAMRVAFKDDSRMMKAAVEKTREEMAKNRHVTDEAEIVALCQGLDDVTNMLLTQVIQAEQKPDGNFRMKVEKRHTSKDEKPPWESCGQ